ncbi:NADH-quinone oxidoreductase subunit N [Fontimonas sp. SYSU GA230001]|uniref:NADH-quinone oxidoreductase subunit N n=1 Tax=Fontimonas sp. SYSU GA230001 TaxID=3142450 RepID=UPI0032B3FAF1
MTPSLGAQLSAAAPLILMAGGIVLIMLLIAARRDHRAVAQLTTLGFVLTFGACFLAHPATDLTPLLVIDTYARFAIALIAAAGGVTVPLLYAYLGHYDGYREEMYLLLLLAAFGAMVLVCARHAASLLLGLETMGVALFGMIAYPVRRKRPLEAGIKYLVLSAAATATLLFGFALLYAATGSLHFATLGSILQAASAGDARGLVLAGLALIWAGFAFKLSLVPFHLWTADVLEGAPAPVAGFLATVSKGAVALLLLRWLDATGLALAPGLAAALAVVAALSILVGNLAALQHNNLKRLLAYSSIAHFGYLLVPFLVLGATAHEAVLFYVAAYTVMTLGCFAAIAVMSGSEAHDDADHLYDYRGLFWRRPLVTSVFVPMLLAQAGVPLTLGFLAKFYVLTAAVERHAWWLALAVVVGSAIGLYYYLRVVVVQFLPKPGMRPEGQWSEMSIASGVALALLLALLIGFGVWPQPLAAGIGRAAAALH